MSQVGILVQGKGIGRAHSFPITKSSATTVGSVRVMVTPAGASASVEWDVSITAQTDDVVTVAHILTAEDMPTAGTYKWCAHLYDADGDEFDHTFDTALSVRESDVDAPPSP